MFIQPVARIVSTLLTLTSLTLPTTSPKRQTPEATLRHFQAAIVQLQAENAAVREKLRELEQSQRILLEIAQRLQRPCVTGPPGARRRWRNQPCGYGTAPVAHQPRSYSRP